MTFSDALPVQFWLEGCATFNESESFAIYSQCFCQPWQCDDEIKIQLQDTTGLDFDVQIFDEDGNVISTVSMTEVDTGVYFVSFLISDEVSGCDDSKIQLKVRREGSVVAKSDCLHVKTEHEGTVLIEYSNNRNYAGIMDYNTSPDLVFEVRVPAMFFKQRFPETDEVLTLSNNRIISLNSQVKKQRFLQTDQMPFYMHLKLKMVLKHHYVNILDREWVKEEIYEEQQSDNRHWPFAKGECWLTEKQYVVRNVL